SHTLQAARRAVFQALLLACRYRRSTRSVGRVFGSASAWPQASGLVREAVLPVRVRDVVPLQEQARGCVGAQRDLHAGRFAAALEAEVLAVVPLAREGRAALAAVRT